MSDSSHDDAHTGPVKTPKQLLLMGFFSFVIPVFVIIGLVKFVTSENKPAAGATDVEQALMHRIQKVGSVEIRDANRELANGETVFKAQCTTCHLAGVAGAPKLGDAAAWAARIATGLDALVHSALKGKGAMAPQGGGDFEDIEIARAVVYMANAAGAKFTPPAQPAAAASAPEGAAAAAPAAPASN